MLKTTRRGIYSSAGRLLLFSVTLAVVALVIAALIRWIAQISDIGRVGHTIDRVESATASAIRQLREHPLFDCREASAPQQGQPVHAAKVGYVQHFDAASLQKLAERQDLQLFISARPGTYVSPIQPLMLVEGDVDDDLASELESLFVVSEERTFENDPRFGLIVLTEIADRALSPAVNDPGTAIDVIGRFTRLLKDLQPSRADSDVPHDRLSILPLLPQDIVDDAFRPLVRDGAGTIEVVLRLMTSLEILAKANPWLRQAAIAMARDTIERAEKALTSPTDLRTLRKSVRFAVEPGARGDGNQHASG